MQAMEQLIREGKVTYIGSSNFAGWHIASMYEEALKSGIRLGLVSEQCGYSLLRRSFEVEVIPAAEGYGMGITPWAPLAGGLLGGVLAKEKKGRTATENVQEQIAALRPQLTAWEELCAELGEEPAHVALAWLLSRPAVTAPILGPRTIDHLESALPALDLHLEEDVLAQIDDIFPGPKAESPEAYWEIPGISYERIHAQKR